MDNKYEYVDKFLSRWDVRNEDLCAYQLSLNPDIWMTQDLGDVLPFFLVDKKLILDRGERNELFKKYANSGKYVLNVYKRSKKINNKKIF